MTDVALAFTPAVDLAQVSPRRGRSQQRNGIADGRRLSACIGEPGRPTEYVLAPPGADRFGQP